MTQKTKKHSAAKKLVPAAGMLAVSAMMLATSTYAWFTMSREVEVQNIKLTATVPADMQISLGTLDGVVAGSSNGVAGGYGTLAFTQTASVTSADDGNVLAPDDTAEYWSNSVDISKYYALGKIMPASSTEGKKIFFTPDASGVGKTLKAGAQYFAATNNDGDGAATDESSAGNHTYATTLHAYKPTEKTGATLGDNRWDTSTGSSQYVAATAPKVTNDDGYYVDIPVWIRTSYKGNEEVKLAVDAYVTSNSKQDDDDLYLAARAVILDSTRKANSSGLLEIKPDSYELNGDASKATIVDFMDTTNAAGEAVDSLKGTKANYDSKAHYDGALLNWSTLTQPIDTQIYGTAKQFWIRVWLEGEDPNCWNENAGQDFSINLKFTRDRFYNSAAAGDTVTQNYPDAISFTAKTKADSEEGSLKQFDQVSVTGASVSKFEYDGTTWFNKGTFTVPGMGQHYTAKLGDATADGNIKTEAELITWLNGNVETKADAAKTVTLEAADDANITAFKATVTVSGAEKTVTYSVSNAAFTAGGGLDGKKFQFNGVTYDDEATLEAALKAAGAGNYIITPVAST